MQQTVYTASPDSQQIHVWRLDASRATLTLVQVLEVDSQVQPLVISPDGRFLYAGVRPEFRLLAFHIARQQGTLSFAGSVPLPGSPTHISLDSHGHFLFSSSYNAGCVSVTRLEQGMPVATEQVIHGLDGCHSATLSTDQRTLWVPALRQDRICLFTLQDDGKLVAHNPAQLNTPAGAGPRHMAFHPRKPVAYCINELNACVDVWLWQDGQIRCIQRQDMLPATFTGVRWAADIHITPDGRFLYACERTSSVITVFGVAESGCQLSVLACQPVEQQPRGFNLDKYGEFLIASGQKSSQITLYAIDKQHGTLQEKGRYPTGKGTMWVVVNAE